MHLTFYSTLLELVFTLSIYVIHSMDILIKIFLLSTICPINGKRKF